MANPKYGSCRCGRFPVPKSRYSYREENELKMIEENIRYDAEKRTWVASYPYLFPKETLKGNRQVALKSLLATEKTLGKNKLWGEVYDTQIRDMVERGAVRIVPEGEVSSY